MDNCNFKPNKPKKEMCSPEIGMTIVIIPEQSGDSDGPFAPQLGAYKNVIVKYLADGKVFVYDKDGNYTFIGVTNAPGMVIDTELSLSSTNAVQNKVITAGIKDAKDTASGAMDAVDSEVSARQHADGVLQDNIDAEVLARQQADGTLQGNIDAEALARQNADGTLQGNIDAEALARSNAITATENKVNRDFINDLVMTADANNVTFTEQKINPVTGVSSSEQDIIPAASTTTAGIISASEYQSILDSEELTQAILEGAVAIAGISPTATQADLTNAWLTATDREEVINRASIFDIDNQLIWTYYTNAALWYSATASITIDAFTNSTAGTIKGSTTDGRVSAVGDGTGAVSGWSTVKNDITSLQTNKADASSLATVATTGDYDDLIDKPSLATVATTGAYSDLTGKPSLATVATSGAYSDLTGTPSLATVATSGNYNDLSNKPSIPAAQVQSNWTQSDNTKADFIKNKPSLATVATSGSYNDLSNKPSLATVATSGSYNDLSNKPTIPVVNNATLTIQKNGTQVAAFTANQSTNATANITVPTKTSDLTNNSNFVADASYVHTDNNFTTTLKNKLDGIASGAEVNVQADWNVSDSTSDAFIKNKPTIPTVNNATLTIQKNGVNVQTFTANSSSNKTANITVPEITMTTTDPGEGAALAANNFIAVYE